MRQTIFLHNYNEINLLPQLCELCKTRFLLCRTYSAYYLYNILSGAYAPACNISSLRDFCCTISTKNIIITNFTKKNTLAKSSNFEEFASSKIYNRKTKIKNDPHKILCGSWYILWGVMVINLLRRDRKRLIRERGMRRYARCRHRR